MDLRDGVVGEEEMSMMDRLNLSWKGAAVLADGRKGVVGSGLDNVRNLNEKEKIIMWTGE